jgi:hypothetical protein
LKQLEKLYGDFYINVNLESVADVTVKKDMSASGSPSKGEEVSLLESDTSDTSDTTSFPGSPTVEAHVGEAEAAHERFQRAMEALEPNTQELRDSTPPPESTPNFERLEPPIPFNEMEAA